MDLTALNYAFGSAVRRFYARYADPSGRSSRGDFWWVMLYQVIIFCVLFAVMYMAKGGQEFFAVMGEAARGNVDALEGFDGTLGFSGLTAAILMILFAVANFVPNIMLRIRRFHDLGYTGWLVLAFLVVGQFPVIGTIAGIFNLLWFITPGQKGSNRFGEDPLG